MSILYGVNSATAANAKLSNGSDLFSAVMRQNGYPAFWGRELSGDNKITPEEKIYLQSKNCKVALIFDELTESQVAAKDGSSDAIRAVNAAHDLGVPATGNVALFANIESDWDVNYNWMISYANTLLDNGYIPGFIGNTDASVNFNFDNQCSQYVQSMGEIAQDSTVYWATEPKISGEPYAWTPYCPTALAPEQISLWRSGRSSNYGDYVVTLNYSQDESVMQYMWGAMTSESAVVAPIMATSSYGYGYDGGGGSAPSCYCRWDGGGRRTFTCSLHSGSGGGNDGGGGGGPSTCHNCGRWPPCICTNDNNRCIKCGLTPCGCSNVGCGNLACTGSCHICRQWG